MPSNNAYQDMMVQGYPVAQGIAKGARAGYINLFFLRVIDIDP